MVKITKLNDNNKVKVNKDIISIAEGEHYTQSKPDKPLYSYVCNYCSRTLSKIVFEDNDNSLSLYCTKCDIEFPQDQVRRKSKITVPEGQNTETLVAATPEPFSSSPFDKPKVEPKGVFAELQKRGIKIKDYRETDGAGRTIKVR